MHRIRESLPLWFHARAEGVLIQSLNRYAYVLNNPTTLVDPLGLQSPGDNCSRESGASLVDCVKGVYCMPFMGACGSAVLGGAPDPFDYSATPVVVSTWVPPAQIISTIDGVVYPGPLMPGYWTATQVGTALDLQIPGITFTPTGATTATFVSQSSFWPTVGKFVQKGFTPNPFDVFDRFHPHNLDLRDAGLTCSKHVDIDWRTGGAGQPTQGSKFMLILSTRIRSGFRPA